MTEDSAVERFLELVQIVVDEGAPGFAFDLARFGMQSDKVAMMARRWRECAFEPAEFDCELNSFASALYHLERV